MSLELVMVEGGALDHGAGSPISGGVFVITSVPSTKDKLGAGIYKGPLQYTFSGGNASGFDSGSVATTAPQVINPTATKTKADGQEVIRLGDFGTMAAVGTVSGVSSAVSGPVEVSDAGQSKGRAL